MSACAGGAARSISNSVVRPNTLACSVRCATRSWTRYELMSENTSRNATSEKVTSSRMGTAPIRMYDRMSLPLTRQSRPERAIVVRR